MRQALAAGELRDDEAVEVAAQVLEALAHAHARGIVHRDVKPSNVLLAEAASIDARLLDFGLAQMAEFETLTAIGDVPGTLTYVSPERLRGETASAAADVWAVGVVLWEALARRHPFPSERSVGTSRRIRAGAPPIESLRPDLAPGLRAALGKALALDPRERPSAAAFADELRAPPRRRARPSAPRRAHAPRRTLERARIAAAVGTKLLPAGVAALWTGWVSFSLPFYPAGWPLALTIAAGALGLGLSRFAFPFALAVSCFPLANISIGLALVFAAVAVVWCAFGWSDPPANAVAVAGPLLAPLSLLALLPLLAQGVRQPLRRGVQTFAAVLLGAIVAGIDHQELPFEGRAAPVRLGIAARKSPLTVGAALVRALGSHRLLLEEGGILALAAIAIPYVRGRGPLQAALAGGALLAATALLAPAAQLLPLLLSAALTVAVLALAPARRER